MTRPGCACCEDLPPGLSCVCCSAAPHVPAAKAIHDAVCEALTDDGHKATYEAAAALVGEARSSWWQPIVSETVGDALAPS